MHQPPMRSRFPFLLAPLLALAAVAALQAAPVSFDIPAQPAGAALHLFGQQAGVEVVYPAADLKKVKAASVKGTMEPSDAIKKLLAGTGYQARELTPTNFAVEATKTEARTGSIRGALIGSDGRITSTIALMIRETGQLASADRDGAYVLTKVPEGTYTLIATAEGYQPLHITEVQVHGGRDVTLSRQRMRRLNPADDITRMEPYVVQADNVTELDPFEVADTKVRSFTPMNADLPRTINDAKPYYMFDNETISRSGAVNLEDFLRQRLTMVSSSMSASQNAPNNSFYGDSSVISLRALGGPGGPVIAGGGGSAQTLILINGRRTAGYSITGNSVYQPDLNAIPSGAVERIEVLPSSASGIYGGGAAAGVINVILKRNYVGGEIDASYDTPMDNDAPIRKANVSLGLSLEGGRTSVTLAASYSDSKSMTVQDRLSLIQRGIDRYLARAPNGLYSPTSPFRGSTPNITSSTSLVLKDGTPLNSNYTYVPPGTPANVTPSALAAALLANAGKVNLDFPDTYQGARGLRSAVSNDPKHIGFSASISREMTPWLTMFVDYSHSRTTTNNLGSLYNYLSIPATSPVNPFKQTVSVNPPHNTIGSYRNVTSGDQFSAGWLAKLPWEWQAQADFTWSSSRHDFFSTFTFDSPAIAAASASGALNPFMDTVAYNPVLMAPFQGSSQWIGAPSTLNDLALRFSGPIGHLPAGSPHVTVGLERRREGIHEANYYTDNPVSPDSQSRYLGRGQIVDSVYMETTVPLVSPEQRIPLVNLLDLQLTGRTERFSVGTGTSSITVVPAPSTPPKIVTSHSEYSSSNPMLAFRYGPVDGLMFRANYSTSFLPPTYNQLVGNPELSTSPVNVTDPRRGNSAAAVYTTTLGNASLKPQFTKQVGFGAILTPRFLPNLRISVDYSRFREDDVLGSLSVQNLINAEALFPGRITRGPVPAGDPYGVGPITVVDTSSLNLTRMETSAVDATADYRLTSDHLGVFAFSAMVTLTQTYKIQNTLNAPLLDYNNFIDSNGPGKLKLNGGIDWERGRWGAGWAARYTGPTYITGSPRDPAYTTPSIAYILNGDHVPGQIYHDVFVRYRFGSPARRLGAGGLRWTPGQQGTWSEALLGGLEVTVGVKNVLNTEPPFSSNGNYPIFYSSSFGDPRLRSIWMSVRKEF